MTRHSSGKASRATTGGGPPLLPLPASMITPPLSKLAMPMPERRAARQPGRVAGDSRAAGRAACAAPRRPQARSACRSRGRHGAGSPARPPGGGGSGCRGARTAWRDGKPRARFPGLRRRSRRARDSVTTVSGSLSGRPMLPKRRPDCAVRIEKAKMQAGGHFYGNGIRHLPPSGCIIMHH